MLRWSCVGLNGSTPPQAVRAGVRWASPIRVTTAVPQLDFYLFPFPCSSTSTPSLSFSAVILSQQLITKKRTECIPPLHRYYSHHIIFFVMFTANWLNKVSEGHIIWNYFQVMWASAYSLPLLSRIWIFSVRSIAYNKIGYRAECIFVSFASLVASREDHCGGGGDGGEMWLWWQWSRRLLWIMVLKVVTRVMLGGDNDVVVLIPPLTRIRCTTKTSNNARELFWRQVWHCKGK